MIFQTVHCNSDLQPILIRPGSSVGKEPACNAGDPDSIPGLGRSTGEGIGYPLLLVQLVNNLPVVWET